MEISPLCGRTLFSKDETLWHIKEEFVIDSVLKYYSASSVPYSQETHKHFPSSRSSQLIACSQFSCNYSLRDFRGFFVCRNKSLRDA